MNKSNKNLIMSLKLSRKILLSGLMLIMTPVSSIAQSNLQDINFDGTIQIMAFGDSITRGVGDFFRVGEEVPELLPSPPSEAGYPLRLESILGVDVTNRGVRGESLSDSGVFRFAQTASASPADYVIISEGANDTFLNASAQNMRRSMQAIVNMTKALGKEPVIATIPSPCCGHAGSKPFIDSYNQQYRDIAALNDILLADSDKAFSDTCSGDECFLFNIPDGLHPNTKGYDAMAQTIIAAFYGIDLFAPGGSTELAQALGVDPSTIVVKSPPAPATTTP